MANLFLGAAFVFLAVSTIGLLRMPDVYTRIHASGVGDTLGISLAVIGLLFLPQPAGLRIKLVLLLVAFLVVNPTITHFVGKVSLIHGVWPYKQERVGERSHGFRSRRLH